MFVFPPCCWKVGNTQGETLGFCMNGIYIYNWSDCFSAVENVPSENKTSVSLNELQILVRCEYQ